MMSGGTFVDEAQTGWLILGVLLGGLGLACFAVMWLGKKNHRRGYCANCGKYSHVNQVMFRYNIGMLVARRYAEKGGPFCKGCIHRTFWGYQAILFTVGWLGTISAVVTPFLFLANAYHYLESLLMPSQIADGFSTFATPVTKPKRVEDPQAALQGLHDKLATMMSNGMAPEEIAERLEFEDGVPRQDTLALIQRLEAAMQKRGGVA